MLAPRSVGHYRQILPCRQALGATPVPSRKFSVGIVVVRRSQEGWRCLLLRAFRNWDFPKGQSEPDETPLQTGMREAEEETGLTDLQLCFGEAYRETEPYAGGKVARYYVAVSAHGEAILPVSAELGRPEHHELRWVSFDVAGTLLPPRLQPILEWARSLISPD